MDKVNYSEKEVDSFTQFLAKYWNNAEDERWGDYIYVKLFKLESYYISSL